MKFKISALTACILMTSYSLHAQEDKVERLVVSASGFAQQQTDAPASITVINKEQLEKKPIHDLADAVKGVEGVSVNGNANKQEITIRGLPGEYTLILVDGRRQNSRESRPNGSGGYEGGFIPPADAIERIEVIRGPMSSLYGSDAMGGVINIITKPVTKEWHGAVSMGGTLQHNRDAGDSINGDFYLSGPLIEDKLGLQLYGSSYLRAEDKITYGQGRNDNKNITAKLAFTPTDNQTILLEAGRNSLQRTTTPGKSMSEFTNRGGVFDKNKMLETNNDRNHWALTYKNQFDILHSELSVYQEQTKRVQKTEGVDKATGNSYKYYEDRRPEITNTVFDAKFTAFLPDNVMTFGGQYQYARLKDESSVGGKEVKQSTITADQKALFLEDEFSVTDNLALTGGIRLDDHEYYGKHWNPRAYAVYHLTDEFTIKGGIAKAFKAPSLREISPQYGTSTEKGRAIMYGNRDLKPETSVSQEIGVGYDNGDGFTANVTFFNTEFKDKLTNYDTGEIDPITGLKLYQYDNVGKANIKGIETAVAFPVADNWRVSANYTYINSKRKSDDEKLGSGESLKGYPLDMTPKHSANARVDWQYDEATSFYANTAYTGKQIWAAQRNGYTGARYRSGYTTFDLGMTYNFNKNTMLNLAVLNITDETGPAVNDKGGNWVVDEGRRYWANIKYSF
ncbi:IreA family TonB-dependent siderophore receptor [Proteus mirabilis]